MVVVVVAPLWGVPGRQTLRPPESWQVVPCAQGSLAQLAVHFPVRQAFERHAPFSVHASPSFASLGSGPPSIHGSCPASAYP